MLDGYVKLWRKSLESQVWQNEGLWQLWCYCLMKATHKQLWVSVDTGKGSTEVFIDKGQFIFGRNKTAKETKQKPRTLYDRLLKLEKMKNITIQSNTHYSIITICNWEEYQCENELTQQPTQQPTNNQPTTNQQPTNTYKNVKNVKKNTNTIMSSSPNIDDDPFQEKDENAFSLPFNGSFEKSKDKTSESTNEICSTENLTGASVKHKKSKKGMHNHEIPYGEIINHLNEVSGKNFKSSSKDTIEHINARWSEGYRVDDFKKVNSVKSAQWKNDPKMEQYLRPDTLYRPGKFEGYLNEKNNGYEQQKAFDPERNKLDAILSFRDSMNCGRKKTPEEFERLVDFHVKKYGVDRSIFDEYKAVC